MMSQDGITFLLEQHEKVTALIDAVQNGPGDQRKQRFDELRELLAVHETAEELILRPITRAELPGGDAIADARMAEENQAKDMLAKIEKLEIASTDFNFEFATFAKDVLEHAHNEEVYEFPLVRDHQDAEALASLRQNLERAEKMAPTHPHPSARSTTANAVLGPFAAIVDRIRDALSGAHSR